MRILNQTKEYCLAERAQRADTVLSRLVGLLGRKEIVSGEGLIITCCRSIHMFFMRFAIDVIFVDKAGAAVGLVQNIQPFRMSPYFFRAAIAIELPVGTIQSSHTAVGDLIVIE